MRSHLERTVPLSSRLALIQPQEVFAVPQSPVVVEEDELSRRYANISPQALRDVSGVRIQQFAVAI